MSTSKFYLVVGIFAVAAGCGGGSSSPGGSSGGRTASNGGQCPASSSGQTCTGEDAYTTCVMNACSATYKTAFGNNYASGDFTGGACADLITCEMKCPCDTTATTCEGACTTQYVSVGSTCYTAVMALAGCVTASGCAMPVCTTATATNTATSTKTGTGTGTGCAGMMACCTVLASGVATAAQQCQTALAGQTEVTCNTLLQSYQSAGLCL